MTKPYADLFIETNIAPETKEKPYLQAADMGIEPPMHISSIPVHSLSNGRFFYYLRVRTPEVERFLEHCRTIDVDILGWSWGEVWRTYSRRDEIFNIDDKGIARPIGVFAGDDDVGFEPDRPPAAITVPEAIGTVRQAVLADNRLTSAEKSKINGYLAAIEAIASQQDPDTELVAIIGERLRKFMLQVALRVGQSVAVDMVLDLLNSLKDLFF